MAPRCYVLGMSVTTFRLHRKLWVVPEPVGYDEVLERVLHAGLQVKAPECRAADGSSFYFVVHDAAARPAVWPRPHAVHNLVVGETRRCCVGDLAVDVVRIR